MMVQNQIHLENLGVRRDTTVQIWTQNINAIEKAPAERSRNP